MYFIAMTSKVDTEDLFSILTGNSESFLNSDELKFVFVQKLQSSLTVDDDNDEILIPYYEVVCKAKKGWRIAAEDKRTTFFPVNVTNAFDFAFRKTKNCLVEVRFYNYPLEPESYDLLFKNEE